VCKFSDAIKGVFRQGNPTGNILSPRVAIKASDIAYGDNALLIKHILPPVVITTVRNTNSMEPLIDIGHRLVLSSNSKYLDDLKVGDIIVWGEGYDGHIHSIIEAWQDDKWHCRTQGLNVNQPDAAVLSKEDIKWVALMVIWCREGIEGD